MSFHKSHFEQKPSNFKKTLYIILDNSQGEWTPSGTTSYGGIYYKNYNEAYEEFIHRNTAGGREPQGRGMMLAEVTIKIKPMMFDKSAFINRAARIGYTKKEAMNQTPVWELFGNFKGIS